jgi:hypothetical protein
MASEVANFVDSLRRHTSRLALVDDATPKPMTLE